MSLDENITIEVPEDRFGLYSCDILDPDVVCVHMLLSFLLLVSQCNGFLFFLLRLMSQINPKRFKNAKFDLM